ncbi:ABC transporter permease [Solibacillus merdavium]|uniref:ABC transporter permease n=1 Tax=Solibacillus merdavium TaxID=2762218 RepID=A0ABR8XLJ1_9BACL|nr:ABC transporter permease [Solibacillus merdavium]MBD8032809.1 ABC transporter permease [Solibacillus merdavium]
MWSYFKFEFKQFFSNIKNLAIYFLLTFATLYYVFQIVPNYDPIESVSENEIEARYLTRQEFLDGIEGQDLNGAHPSLLYAIDVFKAINPIDKGRLDALEEGDLTKYAELTRDWYYITNATTYRNELFSYNPKYFINNKGYADEDAFYAYLEQAARYDAYSKADFDLTIDAFEQRTAFQTLERLLKEILPIILFVCVLLLAVDIVTKDRRHSSIIKGIPINDWRKLLVKMIVVFIGSCALLVPLGLGFLVIGFQNSFGHLHLPSPEYAAHLEYLKDGKFEMMTLSQFLSKSAILLFVWIIVIISGAVLLSLIFRQEMVNLFAGLLLIFGENIYFSRKVGNFWDVQNFPTSYIQVGQIISKQRNFYYLNNYLDWGLALQLLVTIVVVIIISMFFITTNKRYKLIK